MTIVQLFLEDFPSVGNETMRLKTSWHSPLTLIPVLMEWTQTSLHNLDNVLYLPKKQMEKLDYGGSSILCIYKAGCTQIYTHNNNAKPPYLPCYFPLPVKHKLTHNTVFLVLSCKQDGGEQRIILTRKYHLIRIKPYREVLRIILRCCQLWMVQ